MSTVVKEILPKPFWEWPKEDNANSYSMPNHNLYDIVYITKINAHGSYPEMQGGLYDTLEEAEKSLENNPYGGKIIKTTYGELYGMRY